MDLKPKQGLDRPEVETARNPAEACDASWDSRDPCSGVGGRSGRGNVPVTPPKSASGARTSVRVLRARSAAADGRSGRENGTCDQKPGRVRGAPVLSRSHTPVMQTATKKSKARKASQPTLSPKMPKRGRGRQRLPLSATECKPEAETEALVSGEETGTVTRNSDNVADPVTGVDENPSFRDDPDGLVCKPQTKMDEPRQCPTSQPTDVKKEEPEDEDKEKDIREELCGMSVQNEDGVGNNTAPPSRKRGRQQKDDKGPRQPKRRKKPPVQYVRCEIEGCGTVLAHPRYLQHHIKYQHLLKKKYVCDHPSCGRLFRLQKQLLRHAKHHTDQRDYICEYCARAFKSSHNLSVHRMIHTGEKPIQCEICGFTCRQKASLNWHMKKHDAEASYQCSCSICGKKFEKKDCVIAHKAKSHPEVLIAEALAANGGSVIRSPTPVPETALVPAQPEGAEGDMFTPLQQVVLSFAPQAPVDGSQGHFLQLPTHPEVAPQHTPTLLQLTTTSPVHSSSISHPQHIQLSTFPASTVTPMTTFDSQSSPLTLNSITTLSSTDTLAPQQTVQWNREGNEGAQILRESELWNGCQQGVAEITWEGNGETKTEIEGITWEREGERQIMLQCADVHGDGLM